MVNKVLVIANACAGNVYQAFMQQVIDKHVMHDRCGQRIYSRLPQHSNDSTRHKHHKAKAKGNEIDIRTLYLVSISGKGGWTNNPKKQDSYLKNANCTLLDHLLSATRGALMLAAIDLLQQNVNMDSAFLQRRLKVIAVIAFLHDLDKMEQLKRDQSLTIALVENAFQAYGLADFLAEEAIELSADQVRFLIELAEDSQAHRHRPDTLPPNYYQNDIKNYVKLADKLDGIWHQHGAEGGLTHLIERLQKDQSLRTDLLAQWQALELFDPHHPFLLDELQRELSFVCKRRANIPPLIEVHQDGRLFMLLPSDQAEVIKQEALQRFLKRLPFSLYLNVSTVGVPELMNEKADYKRYQAFIADLEARNLSKIFIIKRFLVKSITPYMDECLAHIGLKPQWPKSTGQTVSPYPHPDELKQDSHINQHFNKAASLALLLNLKVKHHKKIPNYAAREAQLSAEIEQDVPEWITRIDKTAEQSRRTLLALWVTALAAQSAALEEKIWGENQSLLKRWLEGDEQQLGFATFIEDSSSQIFDTIQQHFKSLMSGAYQPQQSSTGQGHCIFTDAPTNTLIADKMKLHGVNVSAFSGREGRSETVTAAAKGSVHISDVSIAEYKLRQDAFEQQGGKKSGVPSLISSPMTTGLFSALILNNEAQFQVLSIYDLARKKIQQGKVNYRGLEAYNRRYRMARLEMMPIKLVDQINTLRLLLSACLRIGRPIHVFRGLPTYQKAFFYYDAMPPVLKQLLGFNQFRLEQIPSAIETLKIADELINANGLGQDVFKRYANPKTRLGAVCLLYCHLRDRKTGSCQLRNQLLTHYLNLVNKETTMNKEEGALVRLGQKAARIQRAPRGAPQTSSSEEMLTFTLTLDITLGLRAIQQDDEASLINGIASHLETNLVRKDKMCASQYRDGVSLREECIFFAHFFVDEVWITVLKQRPPSQRSRRFLSSVYRMAFLQASKNKKLKNKKLTITENS